MTQIRGLAAELAAEAIAAAQNIHAGIPHIPACGLA